MMSIKLIIVDDAPFIREVVRHILATTDIELIGEATNGEEAVVQVLSLRPDVVLMDLVMPLKSGLEATREILERWPAAKIIACSTLDQNTTVDRAINAGCRRYITKPFKYEELVSTLTEVAAEN